MIRLRSEFTPAAWQAEAAVERSFVPSPVEHPLDLRIVFADDEGEFMRLWHGIHDDKKINWRNR